MSLSQACYSPRMESSTVGMQGVVGLPFWASEGPEVDHGVLLHSMHLQDIRMSQTADSVFQYIHSQRAGIGGLPPSGSCEGIGEDSIHQWQLVHLRQTNALSESQ